MRDVLFVAVLATFFAGATGFVRVCAWLIGPDEQAAAAGRVDDERRERVA